MNYKSIIFLILATFLGNFTYAQSGTHFITNETYRQQVKNDFYNRQGIKPTDKTAVASTQNMTNLEALEFLYAYMPQSDLADYDYNFFNEQVNYALLARNTFSWGKTIPESIFRHFVLVYRVNNEDLDTARAFIYHQLKDRIKDMTMYEAALEVNHWCHEHVNYQPADARTSSPLATIRTSHGRCGEESTLTVTAMRAVGIPARQCYTPRWAHCDDNHAWVEVWVNGKWYFLGACEPDPALNMGWFAVPATRTMMVHTNVFGKYDGTEEVNATSPYFSRINLISNYTDTTHLTILVVDKHNKPVENATVKFKLYNYAEYYTLASKQTDSHGLATLTTGKGDLLIWANKGNDYKYGQIDARTQHSITLCLDNKQQGNEYTEQFEMTPPKALPVKYHVTPEQTAVNAQRVAYEDSLREKYHATYPNDQYLAHYHNANFKDEELKSIIQKSEGNYAEIIKFINNHPKKFESVLLPEFIKGLADKDLRDCPADILDAQLTVYNTKDYPKDVYIKGILPARISNELIRAWRQPLREALNSVFNNTKPTADAVHDYIANQIKVDEECNYFNCPISPMGVQTCKIADSHSRDIFFVAACRSLDIPAYMDNATGELFAYENGKWQRISFKETQAPNGDCTLILHNPNHYTYWINYTIAKFENGDFVTYDYENDERVLKDPIELHLTPGYYMLSTGNRYSDGDVLSQIEFFNIKNNQTIEKDITVLPLKQRSDYYGHINMTDNRVLNKTLQDILEMSGKQKMIICFVTPGNEPTNHLLNEIAQKKSAYEAWGGTILFINTADQWSNKYAEPRNLTVVEGESENLYKAYEKGMMTKPNGEWPFCTVIDQNGTILLQSEGYHIGLGDLLLEEVKK